MLLAGNGDSLVLIGREHVEQAQKLTNARGREREVAAPAICEQLRAARLGRTHEGQPLGLEAEGLQQPGGLDPIECPRRRRDDGAIAVGEETAIAARREYRGDATQRLAQTIEQQWAEAVAGGPLEHQTAEQVGAEVGGPVDIESEPGERQGDVVGAAGEHGELARHQFGAQPGHAGEAGENQVAIVFAGEQHVGRTHHNHSPTWLACAARNFSTSGSARE